MSLNSLQDRMEQRAASMAQMAKRANNPQDIQAMQQRLTTEIQNGTIKPYIGIPLIQELTKRLGEAKAKAAMNVMGAQAPAQGGTPAAPAAPIAQQVMQQAAQESQGVEALPSNLPESYAGGGIIAFEDGGEVEHYEGGGGTSPAGRYVSGVRQNFNESNEATDLRNKIQQKYGFASAVPGLFMEQSDADRQIAKDIMGRLDSLSLPQLRDLHAKGPSALSSNAPPVTEPYILTETDARLQALHGNKSYYGDGYGTTYDKGNVPQTKINSYMQANKGVNQLLDTPPAPPAPPAAPRIPGAGRFKAPTLGSYTPTAATLPNRAAPALTDLNAITKDLPTKQKTVFENAVTASQKTLEDFDKPGNEAREGRLGKREAEQEKNSAMTRALNTINLGFGIAGSKERTVAGALGKEGREGIQNLIQGEAASRAAKERLEDARDNFDIQKSQAKKGNYQAAQTAGREASRDLLAATQFAFTGAQAGNAQATSLYGILKQSDIGEAGVLNQREQLNMSAVDQKNRNVLGIAGLDLQNRQLNQQAASVNAQLQLGRERLDILKGQIAAGDKRAAAALAIAENKAASTWQSSPEYRTAQQQAAKMPPIEAQRFIQNSWLQYKENMLPSLMGGQGGGANIPSFNDLYKATE